MKYAALAIRTVNADMTAYDGFTWKNKGKMVCPDWKPTERCGNGLHALLHGMGDWGYYSTDENALWQVVGLTKEELDQTIDLDGKVKFPSCTVILTGTREEVTQYVVKNDPKATAVHFAHVLAGNFGTATAGDDGTATAGDYGTATAGYNGTATAGYNGTIVIKYYDGNRYRLLVGYIGEDGLKPNTQYKVQDGKFVEVK